MQTLQCRRRSRVGGGKRGALKYSTARNSQAEKAFSVFYYNSALKGELTAVIITPHYTAKCASTKTTPPRSMVIIPHNKKTMLWDVCIFKCNKTTENLAENLANGGGRTCRFLYESPKFEVNATEYMWRATIIRVYTVSMHKKWYP